MFTANKNANCTVQVVYSHISYLTDIALCSLKKAGLQNIYLILWSAFLLDLFV